MNSTIRRYPRTLQQAFGPSNTPDCDLVQSLLLNPNRIKNHYKLDAFKALVVISTVLVLTAAILVVLHK